MKKTIDASLGGMMFIETKTEQKTKPRRITCLTALI
jgi:hypothetical protein